MPSLSAPAQALAGHMLGKFMESLGTAAQGFHDQRRQQAPSGPVAVGGMDMGQFNAPHGKQHLDVFKALVIVPDDLLTERQ